MSRGSHLFWAIFFVAIAARWGTDTSAALEQPRMVTGIVVVCIAGMVLNLWWALCSEPPEGTEADRG